MKKPLIAILAACGLLLSTGCRKSAERVEENLEEAGEKVEDAVDKDGPVENAGEELDETGREIKRKVEKHD